MNKNKSIDANSCYISDRMQKKLNMLDASQVAIIEAPSGYGKTTVMQNYFKEAAEQGDAVYWFTVMDETPTAVYRRFCSEIEKIDSLTGKRLREVDFPNAFTIGEVYDAIRSVECSRKTWFVIDNFHILFNILPITFLTAMLDLGIDDLHIIIITQTTKHEFLTAMASRGIPHITAADLKWEADDIRRYFKVSGAGISKAVANEVKKYTDGWIIAVHLQLCSYLEAGTFSDKAIMMLMEQLIWNKMTGEQQEFFLRFSVFETCTTRRLCSLLNCVTLPDYAADSLSIPFVRYIADQNQYELHAILLDMVRTKRRERGEAFDRECLRNAGDICRDEGSISEAMFFYAQIKDYELILSLDLSRLIYTDISDRKFFSIALEIVRNCPETIRNKYPGSVLNVAWAVRLIDKEPEFNKLMHELDAVLPETGLLRAEWLLLSTYLHFPYLEKMLPFAHKAADMFGGKSSQVILPEAPWALYEYLQITAFHTNPGAADREADMLEEFVSVYSRLTGGHGNGADALFRAELAFLRCDTAMAEIFAYKASFLAEAKRQKIIKIGAERLLASIALLKADANGWQRAMSAIEHAASGAEQNTPLFRAVLDVVHGTLLAELSDFARIAEWLQNTDFMSYKLPVSLKKNALGVHGLYLLGQRYFARLIGSSQARSIEGYTAYTEHIYCLFLSAGYSLLGNRAQAAVYLKRSAEKSLPDGMIHYFAGFSPMLQGLTDELIENDYPHLFAKYKDYKEQYIAGWYKLHNAIVADELPSGLTGREREIAELAAEGLRNNEIAEKLFVSENTVRAHLRSIYQKLDIDRRAKLAEKLK